MITSDHTADECKDIEDELDKVGIAEAIKGYDFHCSCPYGHHGGWVVVEADTAEAVRVTFPPVFASHADVYQIETQPF
jgi:hypothetical protein